LTTLLDTNVCIAYLNGTDERVRARLTAISPQDVVLCSVVKAELLFGARKSQRVEENLRRLEIFFGSLNSLPFDDRAASHYGIIRAQLEAAGTPIGANDLLIASIALGSDLTLATRNVGEFRRLAGLRADEW
jgi:tRNA(fMet)-specific endonuclease VapC